MRVALSALALKPGRTGGGETVLVHLLPELVRVDADVQYLLFVSRENRGLFAGLGAAVECQVAPAWVRGVGRRVLYEMAFMPGAVEAWGADLFFAVNQVASPLFSCPVSSLVQNLLYYQGGRFCGRRSWRPGALARRAFFGGMGRLTVRRARQVIAVSATARQVVRRCAGVERVEVVPLAAAPVEVPAAALERVRARMGAPFFLYVGALEPYKKVDRLIEALARLRQEPEADGVRLALVGAGSGEKALRRLARALGVEEAIEWVGWLPHDQVGAWYEAAVGVALLSACEAFPLVPLEAMAQGVPVVASNRSAVPEVVGAGGLVLDPDEVMAVAAALRRLLVDGACRAEWARRGRARARAFSWRQTAAQLVRLWRRAIGQKTGG